MADFDKKQFLELRKNLARKNLDKYNIIKGLFGEKWINEEIENTSLKENGDLSVHGLIWLLSNPLKVDKSMEEALEKELGTSIDWFSNFLRKGFMDDRYRPRLLLDELEESLTLLKNQPRIGSSITKAKNRDQFWATMSEIELAGLFKRNNCLLAIEPNICGKTPDLLIELDKKSVIVEVYTPQQSETAQKTMENGGGAFADKFRLKSQIKDKLAQLPVNKKSILIINNAFSGQDLYELDDAIIGQTVCVVPLDPSGKIEVTTKRKKNGLVEEKDFNKIGAIALYKRSTNYKVGIVTHANVKRIEWNETEDITESQRMILSQMLNEMIYRIKNPNDYYVP